MSKSSTAALSTVTSSLSGEREKGRQRGGESGGKGRKGEGKREREREREGGRDNYAFLHLYKTTTCTLALTSELPKDNKILVYISK